MRDNWTVGWSEHYTVGVWAGNSDGSSMQNVLGVSGAGPIWHDLMRYLHQDLESKQPPKPESLMMEKVSFVGIDEAPRQEYFLAGTEMKEIIALAFQAHEAIARIKIQSPVSGSILALDPDIPQLSQKLHLKANISVNDPRSQNLCWEINGTEIGHGDSHFWSPQRGRHRIVLKEENGTVLDEVLISVR